MMGACVTNKNNLIHSMPKPELPDDCLKLIFNKLNTKQDRDSFGLTCHNFLDIQNSCRKHLDFKSSYSKNDCENHHDSPIRLSNRFNNLQLSTSCDQLLCLLNRFTHLKSLSLSNNSDKLLDSSLKNLRKYLCRLHSIDLSDCSYLSDKGLTSVASSCPLLSVIHLRDCKLVTDKGLNFLTKICKSLKQVDLSGCSNITDTGIGYINQNCRQIRALRISGCLNILGVGFRGFSNSLASLEAEHCNLDSTGVAAILSGGGLEYLNLSDLKYKPNRGGVLYLNLSYRKRTLGAIDFGGFGENIRFLDIAVDNYAIMNIAKECSLLQEWNLSDCGEINISSWESIGLYCQNLKTVHVNKYHFSIFDTEFITGSFIALSSCRRLSVIYIHIRWYGEMNLPQEILNVMRQDVKIREITQKDVLKKKTISWNRLDFTV